MRVILERKEQARECAFTTYAPESGWCYGMLDLHLRMGTLLHILDQPQWSNLTLPPYWAGFVWKNYRSGYILKYHKNDQCDTLGRCPCHCAYGALARADW